MSRRTRSLIVLLRVLAIVNFAALSAVVAPRTWLTSCHEWLSLGTFPSGPITGYLARSTSLWFASFGVFLWFVSRDVARYSRLILFVGWSMVVQGISMIVIDFQEGLPTWWIAAEGPSCVGLGLMIVALCNRQRD